HPGGNRRPRNAVPLNLRLALGEELPAGGFGYRTIVSWREAAPMKTHDAQAGFSGHSKEDLRERLQAELGEAFTIERELPRGGMSRVFVAKENALGRLVVIKVLAPELSATLSAERFKREIVLAARLQHPNIVPLLASDIAGQSLYYTMPLVNGES